MIELGIVLLTVGIFLLVIGICAEVHNWDCCRVAIGWCSGCLIILGVVSLLSATEITPMDVYQGKTTLQYTIVDSVKVDSTVVWKIKEEINESTLQ